MCGINGIYSFTDELKNPKQCIEDMNRAIALRGPDAKGVYLEEKVALGHRRLSIIDTSENANQPMCSLDNRYTLVFNGEIYNYKELKKELNYSFKTNSDSEVIIASYIKWGKNCVNKLEGMFAFAIWDKQNKEMFITRDRIGIKPLYFFRDENLFIFSSQIKGVLASKRIKAKINSKELSNYLKFQTTYSPNTILENIFSLESGSYISITKEGLYQGKYWDIEKIEVNEKSNNYDVATKTINKLLDKSVSDRMVSDVPFGAFLSGGIDSSLMVALMSKHSNHAINTFNISFNEREFSEAVYAEKIAKQYNTNHTEIQITPQDLLNDIENALDAMDSPSADGINTYVVSKHTKKHGVKMAISGLGGDELFAGYPQFKQAKLLDKLSVLENIPLSLRTKVSDFIETNQAFNNHSTQKIAKWMKSENWNINNLYPTFRQQYSDRQISEILKPNSENKINYFSKSSLINNISINEINTYLQHILLRDSDQMSMASALEVRVPFMDHNLVEYVLSLPDKYKSTKSQKKLLADSFPNILTDDIVNRKKMGFLLPWDKWLKNELKAFVEINLNLLEKYPELNFKEVKTLWENYKRGDKGIFWTQIWGLVVLAYWLDKNVDL